MLNTRGFTLFEIVLSLALLSFLMLLTVQVLFSEIDALMRARADRNAVDTASAILERLTQEVRLARSVVIASSTIGTNPGRLVLQTYATPTSTVLATVDIARIGTGVSIRRDANATTTLVGTHARVTELLFHYLTSSSSEMVRMTITVKSGAARFEKEKQLTTAAVLRGSY